MVKRGSSKAVEGQTNDRFVEGKHVMKNAKGQLVAIGEVSEYHAEKQPGRNDKCPCGSSKKFKNCCMQ
jgi:uncharacterized protein YecA (UPF0149 family)